MFFDIQRFDGNTTTTDRWYVLTESDETHYTETDASTSDATVFWGFVPAGASYTNGASKSFSGNTGRAWVIAKDDVKLKINQAKSMLSGNTGYPDTVAWGFMSHGVPCSATAVTLELYSGQSVSDLVVEGANKEALKITINGTVYNVYCDGSVDTMAPYGFLLKTDKRALDKLGSDTTQMKLDIIDLNVAVQTAVAGGEMTADGFVLKNNMGLDVATIQTVGLDAETAAATYATKDEMREYVRQVIASDTGYTFINGSGTTVAQIPIMQ